MCIGGYIFNKIVYGKKPWFLIRLDAVNPDDIFEGLGGYKYFDYRGLKHFEELSRELERKLKNI